MSLNFLTPNFIAEEDKHEMDMQRAYIWTSRTSNAQFFYAFFGYYLKFYFAVCVSLYVRPIFRKQVFLEHLCTMTSISSIEKDFIVTTPVSFKDCIFPFNISNQVQTNLEKRKVQQAASGNFVHKWLFCKTYVLYNMFLYLQPKFFKNTFEVVVRTYYRFFSRKIHIHMENLLNGYFYYSSFTSNFMSRYF